jgi:hypothetical protein
VARIDKGIGADAGDGARLTGSDVAEQVADDALGEVVGLDLVVDGELLKLGAQAPVPADDAPDQPFMA